MRLAGGGEAFGVNLKYVSEAAATELLGKRAFDGEKRKTIFRRGMARGAKLSLYIEEMFETGHDAANRATVKARHPDEMSIVGLALREERKLVDKITKGAKMHA